MIHHITRATRHLIFWSLISLALASTVIRITLATITDYKETLAHQISHELGVPVSIASLAAGMRGFRPELVLKDVRAYRSDFPKQVALTIAEIHLSLNLLDGLSQQQIMASSWLTLIGTNLTLLHQQDGSIRIPGLGNDPNQSPPLWLLQTTQIELLRSRIGWQEAQNPSLLFYSDVDFSLQNTENGQQHRLNIIATPPAHLAKKINLAMRLQGNFLAPQQLSGFIYAEAKSVQLENPYLNSWPLDITLKSGQADLQLWSKWQNSALQTVTGNVHITNAELNRSNHAPLMVNNFEQQFKATVHEHDWQLLVEQLSLKTQHANLPITKIKIDGKHHSEPAGVLPALEVKQIALQTGHLDLHEFTTVHTFFSTDTTKTPFDTLQGQFNNLELITTPTTEQFSVSADFEHLGLQASGDIPGFNQLSGHIEGNQQHGIIEVNAQGSVLDLPQTFAKPLPLNNLSAHFTWQQTENSWEFESPAVTLTVPDLQANSRLKLMFDKQSWDASIDLTTAITGNTDIHTFSKYFPTALLGSDTVGWLDSAFLKGRVEPRGAILRGKLADFPFHKQEGVFQIDLDIFDIGLNYASDWKPLEKLDAKILFYQDGMQVVAQHAYAQEFKFSELEMHLKSFNFSDYLTIDGAGEGDMRQIIDYLQNSPIASRLTAMRDIIEPEGATGLKMNIQIPLIDEGKIKVAGTAHVHDARFNVLPLDLPVNHIQGTLKFDEDGLNQGALTGQTLDSQISCAIKNLPGKLQIDLQGSSNMIGLAKQFKQPLWLYAEGETDYQLKLQIPDAENQHLQLDLNSDLIGLKVMLPDVLYKTPNQSKPFNLHIQLTDQSTIPINIHYAGQLQAALNFDPKQRRLHSGQILIGTPKFSALATEHLALQIHLPRIAANEWLKFTDQEDSTETSELFDILEVNTEHLMWHEQDTGHAQIKMHRDPNHWHIQIDSPLLKGKITKPFNTNADLPTLLQLDYLNFSGLNNLSNAPSTTPTSNRLPLFNLTSEQVLWNKVDLGQLAIKTQRITNGIEFKSVTLKHSHGTLELTGNWISNASEQVTSALGTLKMQQFGEVLEQLDFTSNLKNSEAFVEFAVNWNGAPQNFALEKLEGRIDVELKNGRILSIEPGFGRVLGFLAMEQWGRRLRLDFSDLLAQGLTFNSIAGHFDLHQGVADTDKLKIDAIPAMISISGPSELSRHSLNHQVSVLPKSSAALPIAGTIVDEVLTFAVETLTGTPQEGFLLGSEYKLEGTWDNPKVIQVHDNDGLLSKTWSGLTDFSWLTDTTKK